MKDATSTVKWTAAGTVGTTIGAVIAVAAWLFPEPLSTSAEAQRQPVTDTHVIVLKTEPQPPPPRINSASAVSLSGRTAPRDESPTRFLNPHLRAITPGSWPWAVLVYGESQADDVMAATTELLQQRGRHTVRLFRNAAAERSLAPELFGGSPSLAGDLQLGRYCARLLIGRLRTTVNESEGTLIGEATVTFRLLTPEGQLVSSHEISAKAGGTSDESAKERAVAELRSSMGEQMSELLQ